MFEAMWSKNVRSDFFQILNTCSFHSNEQNICVKFSKTNELWENISLSVLYSNTKQIS